MTEIINVKIENLNGELYVSSRDIAEGLGKQHKHVLEALDKLIKSDGRNVGSQIIPSTYINSRGKEYREYLLTKDGFILYMFNVQGYNEFKMAYINRFNEMEKALQKITMVENTKANLLLSIYNGGQEGVVASKELVKLETTPLLEKIEEDKPKVDYCKKVLDSENTYNITQIAKDYGLSAKKMNSILHDLGIQYKSNNQWILYSKYRNEGYVESYTNSNDKGFVFTITKWTQKGRMFIYETLKENGYLPLKEKNLK